MARQVVVWTKTAWRDLEHAADYISNDSPGYAAAFVERVRDRARSLEELPLRGRLVPEFADPLVRELLVDNHRLVYETTREAIYILALIHGARDLAALWEREERSP